MLIFVLDKNNIYMFITWKQFLLEIENSISKLTGLNVIFLYIYLLLTLSTLSLWCQL